MRVAVFVAVLFPALLAGCLPPQLGGRPPSFGAFLRRNGLQFEQIAPAPPEGTAAAVVAAQRDGPHPGGSTNPPVHGVLSCPVVCRAVLSEPGEAVDLWFVSYRGTEYGLGDIEWVLVDGSGVSVISTSDNP